MRRKRTQRPKYELEEPEKPNKPWTPKPFRPTPPPRVADWRLPGAWISRPEFNLWQILPGLTPRAETKRRFVRWINEKDLIVAPTPRLSRAKRTIAIFKWRMENARRALEDFQADRDAVALGFAFIGEPKEVVVGDIEEIVAAALASPPKCESCDETIGNAQRVERALRISQGRHPARYCDRTACRTEAARVRQRESRHRKRVQDNLPEYLADLKYAAANKADYPVFGGLAFACDGEWFQLWRETQRSPHSERLPWPLWPEDTRSAHSRWRQDGGYFKSEGTSFGVDPEDFTEDRVTTLTPYKGRSKYSVFI